MKFVLNPGHPAIHRANYLQAKAVVGAAVTYKFPTGVHQGTVTKVSDRSVWAEFQRDGGRTTTHRFSQRVLDAEYRMTGTGQYAPVLEFQA